MSTTKENTKTTSSFWGRIYKIVLTTAVVVSVFFSFTNHYDIESFKKSVGPIGTNPLQLNPTKFISAEVGSENMHPGTPSTDSIVGHNNTTKMFTMLNKNDLGFATTASLSSYVTNSSLSSTLSGYVTNSGLTGTLSSYVTSSSLTSTLGSYVTGSSLTSTLSGYVPTSRTLTINGTAFDLSANRTWTIPGNTYSAGTGLSLVGSTFNNTAPDQTVSLTAGNRIQVTGTYPNFTVSYIEPTPTIVTRSANSNYTISSTKQATVVYSITATTTNPLLVGTSAGTAYLEYSTNGGSTWLNPSQVASTSAVGVTVTVALTTGNTSSLGGVIPANALVRIRTTTSGTATVTYVVGQETY